jgi:hypothetical protein
MTPPNTVVPVELKVLQDHIADLDRCADIFEAHSMFDTAEECRKAGKELTDAIAAAPQQQGEPTDGWKEAAIAWEVCASIHREYAKGKDPFYSTRQADFVRHAEEARTAYAAAPQQPVGDELAEAERLATVMQITVKKLQERLDYMERALQEHAARSAVYAELVSALIEMGVSVHKDCTGIEPKPADMIFVVEEAERIAAKHKASIKPNAGVNEVGSNDQNP